VLCETVWVLVRTHRFSRDRVGDAVSAVLAARNLHVEEPDDVRAALAAYRAGRGDLADYLIRERARRAGALPVATFDVALHADAGFVDPAVGLHPPGDGRVAEKQPRYGRRKPARRKATRR